MNRLGGGGVFVVVRYVRLDVNCLAYGLIYIGFEQQTVVSLGIFSEWQFLLSDWVFFPMFIVEKVDFGKKLSFYGVLFPPLI